MVECRIGNADAGAAMGDGDEGGEIEGVSVEQNHAWQE